MAVTPYVFDATAENYQRLVLENSEKGPVLVNYLSPRAGPCMMLMPRLVRLAAEFGGRFLLVMLNTDELGRLAREQGVNSIPTIKVFRHGKAVDTLRGAESETTLRTFIRKHVAAEADILRASAIQAYQKNDMENAVSLAARAALAQPDDPRAPLDLLKLMVLRRQYAEARALLDALPAVLKENGDIRDLDAHIRFITLARAAPEAGRLEETLAHDPDNLEARFQLSARMIMEDNYERAMEQLLEIIRRDETFQDHAAEKGLTAVFKLLGDSDERVTRYRKLLRESMDRTP